MDSLRQLPLGVAKASRLANGLRRGKRPPERQAGLRTLAQRAPLGGVLGGRLGPLPGGALGGAPGGPGGGAGEPPLPGGSREGGLAGWEGVWMGA